MLSLYDKASIAAAMGQPLDGGLRSLLEARLEQSAKAKLLDLTHIVVVQPGDTEAQIACEIGFSPLVDPLSGARFGSADFAPYWPWLRELGGWFELIVTVGNSGFAFIIFIERATKVLPELLRMCEQYGSAAPCA